MKPLRIATLNCLNLALPGRRFYGGIDPYTADEYIAKTQWLAAMLDRLAADVVLLQEVFHEQALADVVRQTVGGAQRWSLAAPLAPQDNDRPRLGMVWRQPCALSWQSIAAFPPGAAVEVPEAGTQAAFARPLLRAEIPLAGSEATLTLVNVHLKSRRPDFVAGEDVDDPAIEARARLRSLIRRGAEAAALRRLLLASATPSTLPLHRSSPHRPGRRRSPSRAPRCACSMRSMSWTRRRAAARLRDRSPSSMPAARRGSITCWCRRRSSRAPPRRPSAGSPRSRCSPITSTSVAAAPGSTGSVPTMPRCA